MPKYSKYQNESKKDFEKRMAQQKMSEQVQLEIDRTKETEMLRAETDTFFKGKSKSQVADIQDWLQKNPTIKYPYHTGKLDSIPGPKTKEAYMLYRQKYKTSQEHSRDKLKKGGLIGTRGRALIDDVTDYIKKLRN